MSPLLSEYNIIHLYDPYKSTRLDCFPYSFSREFQIRSEMSNLCGAELSLCGVQLKLGIMAVAEWNKK